MASILVADCDMMAMISKKGFNLSESTDPNTDLEDDFDDPYDFFDFMRK